ncbi:MAG: hypothetical protein O7J95_20980 [Planctomycetota bacterium]|nr:hypothetical protein [Planctomycetota bacterium]
MLDGELGFTVPLLVVLLVLGAFQLTTAIACFRRASWGRISGMIVCSLMLLNIPVGTLIGVLGLVALAQGARLFGPGRYRPSDLRKELKYRKQHGIL